MKKAYVTAIILALSFFSITAFANAEKDSSEADTILNKILNAVEDNDLNSFVADGDNQFKAAITKQMFDGLNAMISPRMKNGYKVILLGTLNQQGCKIYLRKLVFKDGGDDILARLVLQNGKVAGFWFQ
jgi:ABC-type oligopeptide transport system substrate-binding subunit